MINEFEYNELKENNKLITSEIKFIEDTYKDNVPYPIDIRLGTLYRELMNIRKRLKDLERIKLYSEEGE